MKGPFGGAHVKEVDDDVFIHGVQRDPEQGDEHHLDGADFPQQCTVGDQRGGAAEVCVDQAVGGEEQSFNNLQLGRLQELREMLAGCSTVRSEACPGFLLKMV